MTGAEVLTSFMRREIARSLGATVLEIYGSYEVPAMAWQCRETGVFHVGGDGVILEVLTADGRAAAPGETGEVVVTALHSFAMPFIRYRLGALVTQGEPRCRCGAARATRRVIQGRMLDYFALANGRTIHSYGLTTPVIRLAGRWLAQYQLTQVRPDHLVMRIVPKVPPASAVS